jgi:hypothetical protein
MRLHLDRNMHCEIQRDEQHGRYNGFRNTFDEWQERAADPGETRATEEAEGELEQLRRTR